MYKKGDTYFQKGLKSWANDCFLSE